jgi:hypothetical protein
MGTEFGWWVTNDDQGKFQVRARVHGGQIEWQRKQGHHSSWDKHPPTAEDWDQLLHEAGKRVPRRLLSPKQFDAIRLLRERAGA